MRWFAVCLGVCSWVVPTLAVAGVPIHQEGNFGLGLGGGVWSSGLSAKYYVHDNQAVQAVVGMWGVGRGGSSLGLTMDYLLQMPPTLVETEVVDLNWSVGPGIMVILAKEYQGFGLTGAAGLELNFKPAPVDLVFEYRPALLITPDIVFDAVGFGAHVRYYF